MLIDEYLTWLAMEWSIFTEQGVMCPTSFWEVLDMALDLVDAPVASFVPQVAMNQWYIR
jgi:hypothetical protein